VRCDRKLADGRQLRDLLKKGQQVTLDGLSFPVTISQQFQIQNVVQDTKALKCLRSRGFVSICGISVMLYLVIDQVCLQVADSPRG
jgi:hypothetical protein